MLYMYPNSLFTALILELPDVIHVLQLTVHCIDIRASRCDTCSPIHSSHLIGDLKQFKVSHAANAVLLFWHFFSVDGGDTWYYLEITHFIYVKFLCALIYVGR